MRVQKADRSAVDTLRNHFIGKLIPGVGTWGELDVARGFKDDFLGRVISGYYLAVSNGAGSGGTLAYATHGQPNGVYRLTAGAGAGFYHYLWFGDGADTYPCLDGDVGWAMMALMQLSATTNFAGDLGANDAASNNVIRAGLNTTAVAANWSIVTRTGGGAVNSVDTGVTADVLAHWHKLEVFPIGGGLRQVDYFLDATKIASTTTSVPTAALTPLVRAYAVAGASRFINLDAWLTIPRDLA